MDTIISPLSGVRVTPWQVNAVWRLAVAYSHGWTRHVQPATLAGCTDAEHLDAAIAAAWAAAADGAAVGPLFSGYDFAAVPGGVAIRHTTQTGRTAWCVYPEAVEIVVARPGGSPAGAPVLSASLDADGAIEIAQLAAPSVYVRHLGALWVAVSAAATPRTDDPYPLRPGGYAGYPPEIAPDWAQAPGWQAPPAPEPARADRGFGPRPRGGA